MSDEAQDGRATRYAEMLEKYPHWTPETISGLPLPQLFAIFAPKENVFHSFAEARAALKAKAAEKNG